MTPFARFSRRDMLAAVKKIHRVSLEDRCRMTLRFSKNKVEISAESQNERVLCEIPCTFTGQKTTVIHNTVNMLTILSVYPTETVAMRIPKDRK